MRTKPFLSTLFLVCAPLAPAAAQELAVDYRYAPDWHVSTPALPDDAFKTLVAPYGQLLYDYGGTRFFPYALGKGFRTVIHMLADEDQRFEGQRLRSARVPVVETRSSLCGMEVVQEVYATCGAIRRGGTPCHPLAENREDMLLTEVGNPTSGRRTIRPVVVVDSEDSVAVDGRTITVGGMRFRLSLPVVRVRRPGDFKTIVELSPVTVGAGETLRIVGICDNGLPSDLCDRLDADPEAVVAALPDECERVERFWLERSGIPYGRVEVPDPEIRNLIDASIRGIWQAREIVDGKLGFQVGPTCYRGLWIVDGAFLAETAALLGRGEEARAGIEYALSFQREEGGFAKLNPTFWKENGLMLWSCVRHAMLTQDKTWLRGVWPRLVRTVDYIGKLRQRSLDNATPLDDGLIPPGYIDGGLNGGDGQPEYSNTLWNLAGMKAMIAAAQWLGETADAGRWQREYDDFYATFRRAAERDAAVDGFGNLYLNNMMDPAQRSLPQRAQWAFLQSVYPGQLFAADDPLVAGTMAMLGTTLQEGMVVGTGWLADGIWNYFAGFYGHAALWTGDGARAAAALYAFANHASPLYLWREEQNPRDLPRDFVGDMPHNWGSAEFIRLAVHLLQIDRGDELHLLAGIPREWLKPGMRTALSGIATPFGELTFTLDVGSDGRQAELLVEPLADPACRAVVVHADGWGDAGGADLVRLDPRRRNRLTINMKR